MKSNNPASFFFSKQGVITLYGVILLVFIFSPFLKSGADFSGLPYWVHEHFFNTVQIMENVKNHGIASLDGVTLTNDFSIIWTAILFLFSFVSGVHSPVFFALVFTAIAAGAALSLKLLDKLADALDMTKLPSIRFFAYSLFFAMYMRQAVTGMETVWAVPAVFAMALALLHMLEKPSFKSGLICGLSVFLALLVRLDTLGFVLCGAFIFYMQFNGKTPVTLKQFFQFLPGLIIGLIPAVLILLANYLYFRNILPAGMQSWMKVQNIAPWNILTVLIWQPLRYFFRMPEALALQTFPAVVIIMVAYASMPRTSKPQTPADTVFFSFIWFPVIQFGLFAFLTYMSLPEYAFYPLTAGTPFALLYGIAKINERLDSLQEQKQIQTLWIILGILMLVLSLFMVTRPRSAAYRPVAEIVANFTKEHSGIYAMSHGAGITSYLSGMPFVRLDGLGGNKQMQDYLAQQAPLSQVLQHYNVAYYVAVNPQKDKECYAVREPAENRLGGINKGMSDWLCAPPALTVQVDPKTTLMIFAIDKNGKATKN